MTKVRFVDGRMVTDGEEFLGGNGTHHIPQERELTIPDEDLEESLEDFLESIPEIDLSQIPDEPESDHPFLNQAEEIEPDSFKMIGGIMIPSDQPYLPEQYRHTLPEKQENTFCPYLRERASKPGIQDYGYFVNYLQKRGYTKSTITGHALDLKKWGKELDSDITVESINTVLRTIERDKSVHRAIRMRNSLKLYAHYRNFHGDKALLVLLSTSLTLYNPILPKEPRKEAPGQAEIDVYWTLAKELCNAGNPEGIWIGLCLSGITPTAIQSLEFPNKTTVKWSKWGKKQETRIERWLYEACQNIDNWKMNRQTIHRRISRHETTPRELNTLARHRDT